MPTYDYECSKCGRFEHSQSIKEDPLQACPRCGSAVRRLISATAGIVFKGGGFFLTDYSDARSSWGTGQKKGSDAHEGSASAAAAGAGETKPPAKAEKAEKAEKPAKTDKAAT